MKGMQLSNLGLIGVHQYVLHETVDKKQLTFISGKSAFQPYLVFIQLTQHILPAILYKVSLMLEWASKTQIARKIIQLSSWLGPMVHSTPFCKMADSQILLIFHITRIMKVKLINIKKKKIKETCICISSYNIFLQVWGKTKSHPVTSKKAHPV